MTLQQRIPVLLLAVFMALSGVQATEKLTTPAESLNGLRPGTLTIDQLNTKYGKPVANNNGGLLGLYGGAKDSQAYGWFMVPNPSYTVPDLVAETEKNSDKVEMLISIGYDGLKTEKGIACFANEADVIKAYGKPDFAFAVPMNGFVLRELYYPALGLSFDMAPTGPTSDRQVIAIYITYPEYLQRAVGIRKDYIKRGTGEDITYTYSGGTRT